MATKKPRVTVTLEHDDYERLRALSEMNGESMSSLISGLVGSVAPVLERIVEAGRQFEHLQESVRGDVLARLEAAEDALRPALNEVQEGWVAMLETIEEHSAEAAADPRAVTRGSRPPTSPTPPPSDSGAE